MLIAQFGIATDERSGDWYYRTHAPGRAIAKAGHYVVDMPHIHRCRDYLLCEADVVVLNMVPDLDLIPVIEARRSCGMATVFELNDEIAERWHPEEVNKTKRILSNVDAVQFSTPELQRRYGSCCLTSRVFRNMIETPAETPNRKSTRTVVGWGGSAGHYEDIAKVAPALIRLILARPDIEFAIMAAPSIVDLFGYLRSLAPDRFRVVPLGGIDDYYRFLETLDIGIAPLNGTPFNRCRSDVKALEYGSHGVVPVVQLLEPYREFLTGGKSVVFETPFDLVKCIERLVANPEERRVIASRARGYSMYERTEDIGAIERLDLYKTLTDRDSDGSEVIRNITGAYSGRHISLRFGRYERHVWDGITLCQNGQSELGKKELVNAWKLEPRNVQLQVMARSLS